MSSFPSVLVVLCIFQTVSTEITLLGECPDVTLQKKLDYTKFSGTWYIAATFASDGRTTPDCSTLEFQEDNLGFTLQETYVVLDQGNRTQKEYSARADPTFDAGDDAKFIISYNDNDLVLQLPFYILTTDYENYALAYTCKTIKKKLRVHNAVAWVLTRDKVKLEGDKMKQIDDSLSKYPELADHKSSFVYKGFSESSCSFQNKVDTDFVSSGSIFW